MNNAFDPSHFTPDPNTNFIVWQIYSRRGKEVSCTTKHPPGSGALPALHLMAIGRYFPGAKEFYA